MKTNNQMKKNSLFKSICIVAAALTVPLTAMNLLAYLAYDGQAINRINFSNWTARDFAVYIDAEAEQLGIPAQGEAFISGRSDEYGNRTVTAAAADGRTVYLLGSEAGQLTAFWTARMQDGRAQEVWYSKHALTADELHPYSHEAQKNSMHFVLFPLPHSWIDDRALVGYWEYREPAETDNTSNAEKNRR